MGSTSKDPVRYLFILILAAAPAVADFTFETETVLADGMWNNPTSVAVDAAGVIHFAYMQQLDTDSSTKEIWYANKAGGTWSFTRITDNDVREEFPSLTLDPAGNVHIAFHTGVTTTNKIRYVNNVGGSFGGIIDITDPGFVIVEHAVDSAGNVHFVFESQPASGATDVYYREWSPASGLGPLINLSNSPGEYDKEPDVAVGPDDVVHVVYHAGITSGRMVYRNNAGGSFAEVSTGVSGNVDDPLIEVAPDGKISILIELTSTSDLYLVESDGAGGFAPPILLTTVGSYRPAFYDKFAIGADGRRYVTWVSNVDDRGVFFVGETETGFTEPIAVATPPETKQGCSIAINSDGALALTYQVSGFDPNLDVVYADIFLAMTRVETDCPGDLDGDGDVDLADLAALLAHYGVTSGATYEDGDIDGDGDVDLADLATLLAVYDTDC